MQVPSERTAAEAAVMAAVGLPLGLGSQKAEPQAPLAYAAKLAQDAKACVVGCCAPDEEVSKVADIAVLGLKEKRGGAELLPSSKATQHKINDRFSNFNSAVSVGKGRTDMAASLRQQRFDVLAALGLPVPGDLPGQPEEEKSEANSKMAVPFVNREVAVLRSRRRQWTTEDFQTSCVLGQGAFGVVYLAQENESGDYFALKQMKKSRYMRKNHRERAFAEREVLAKARTRWFVQLHTTFQDNENVYMVMEFVQGGELFKHLELKQRFSVQETRFYMAELLEALDTVHKHNFCHRDVKPDNIVLTHEGHLKLLDFGLCKTNPEDEDYAEEAAKFGTGTGDKRRNRLASRVGTPQYMAPESFTGNAGAAADLWALGIVMFECLYGGIPFHAGDMEGHEAVVMICAQVKDHERRFPKRLAKAKTYNLMPPEAEEMLLRIICAEGTRADAEELRRQPFFEGMDFDTVHLQTPPIVPELTDPKDVRYFDSTSRMRGLPKPKAGPKDLAMEWAHYEFDQGVRELEVVDSPLQASPL